MSLQPSCDSLPVVIDLGSHTYKLGFASEDAPLITLLNRLAQNKNDTNAQMMLGDLIPVGRWNRYWRGLTRLFFPVQGGIIQKEEHVKTIMSHVFYNELRVAPDESTLLMTECPAVEFEDLQSYRRVLMNYLMEELNLEALSFMPTSTLSAFAQGELNSVVIEIGEETNHTSSIVDGRMVYESLVKMNSISGLSLKEQMSMSNISQAYVTQREIREYGIGDMKKDFMRVALDYETELEQLRSQQKHQTKSYDLPSGETVEVPIDESTVKYPEAFFNPILMGIENGLSVQDCTYQSIEKVDHLIKKDLCKNIILSGGSTLLNGFDDRLRKEMKKLIPESKIRASQERANLPWIGGSIIGSMSTFSQHCITKTQFEEDGIELTLHKFQNR